MKKEIILASLLLASSTLIADAYQKCVVCHGKSGERAALGGKSLVIKDMSKADIISSLKGYQDGTYGRGMKAMMVQHTKDLTPAQIEEIANKIGK
ncbi:MAG: cytochrome C [Campylobacterota bacterium]|nr:cytochrome C [Campylobacterota bacterium]